MVGRCPECALDVHPAHATCPLCGAPIHPEGDLAALYPPAREEVNRLRRKQRAFSVATACLAAPALICVLINFIVDFSTLWSAYVVGALLIAWLYIFLPPRMPKPKTRYVILLTTVCAAGYLAIISVVTATPSWFLDWVFPFLIAGAEIVMFLFLLFQRSSLRRGYVPVLWMLFLSLTPLIASLIFRLNAEGTPPALWPAQMAAGTAILGMALGFIAARSWLRGEIRRKFHL